LITNQAERLISVNCRIYEWQRSNVSIPPMTFASLLLKDRFFRIISIGTLALSSFPGFEGKADAGYSSDISQGASAICAISTLFVPHGEVCIRHGQKDDEIINAQDQGDNQPHRSQAYQNIDYSHLGISQVELMRSCHS